MPTVAELMAAVPAEDELDQVAADDRRLKSLLSRLALQSPPAALRRFWTLTGLHARIGMAYTMHWLRGWFQNADRRVRDRAETHLKAAYRLLETMGYLRGAIMKIGQTLANFPDVVPDEFVETLQRLHFEAPPMHFALVRESLHNELGGDPHDVFDWFETEAFAAASLGQVHRARLRTGEPVAVKVQYPGIARTIRSDFRALFPLLLPARLSKDWNNTQRQLEHTRRSIERETDYVQEAAFLERARALFQDEDGVVIPRVHRQHSTRRVLTTDLVDGVHVGAFLARRPSQDERNRYAEKMLRAWYRMLYSGRILYGDWHPGNFLFLDDGRLGLVDFGCCLEYDDAEWNLLRIADRPLTTGAREECLAWIKLWCDITDEQADAEFLALGEQYCAWSWRPRWIGRPYDFGDEAEFRRGFLLILDLARKRHTRGREHTPFITRWDLGYHSMMYRLRASIDVSRIAEQEVKAAGWDRSEYAATTTETRPPVAVSERQSRPAAR